MKNILLINDYTSSFGGAEKVFQDEVKMLRKLSYAVTTIGEDKKSENLISFFRRYFSIRHFLETYRVIKINEIDAIHVHSVARNISPSPLVAAKMLKKRVIMTFHDFHYYCPKTWGILGSGEICEKGFNSLCYFRNCKTHKIGYRYIPYHFLRWLKVGLHRILLRRYVDVFICPSRRLREYMIKSLNLNPTKVIYIPNFIDIPEGFYPDFSNIIPNNILFVGRLSSEKGIDVAIKAIDYLVKERNTTDIKFNIIGDGPEKKKLENLVNKLGLNRNVSLLGKIEHNKLSQYYETSSTVLMPSIWLENNPLVALETMKSGRPIIASNVGGFPDLIMDGKNGFLFKMGNHLDLAEKILLLYGNKEKIVKMGKYGFEKVRKEFGSNTFLEKLTKSFIY